MNNIEVSLSSDKCHVYRVQDGDDVVLVFAWKEDGMSFGVHNIFSTCDCEDKGDCRHINTVMDNVMEVTFTFNDTEAV